jgi:hypothetical protein
MLPYTRTVRLTYADRQFDGEQYYNALELRVPMPAAGRFTKVTVKQVSGTPLLAYYQFYEADPGYMDFVEDGTGAGAAANADANLQGFLNYAMGGTIPAGETYQAGFTDNLGWPYRLLPDNPKFLPCQYFMYLYIDGSDFLEPDQEWEVSYTIDAAGCF